MLIFVEWSMTLWNVRTFLQTLSFESSRFDSCILSSSVRIPATCSTTRTNLLIFCWRLSGPTVRRLHEITLKTQTTSWSAQDEGLTVDFRKQLLIADRSGFVNSDEFASFAAINSLMKAFKFEKSKIEIEFTFMSLLTKNESKEKLCMFYWNIHIKLSRYINSINFDCLKSEIEKASSRV